MPHLALRVKYHQELYELYGSFALRTLAMGMINIFIPLYLFFQLSYSLREVMLFLLVMSLTQVSLTYFAAKIASFFGLKHMVLISMPVYMVYFFSLIYLPGNPILYFPAALFWGIGKAFFWTPYHIELAKSMKAAKRGQETSNIFIINNITGFIGPVLGGILITFVNFNFVYSISMILLVFSTVPLFLSKEKFEPITVSFKNIFKKFRRRNLFAFWGSGIQTYSHEMLWPIYIFALVGLKYTNLGYLTSLTLLISIAFTIFVGQLSDKIGKRKILKVSSLLHSALYFARITVNNFFSVVFFHVMIGLVRPTHQVPFLSRTYDKASLEPAMVGEFVILREIMTNLGGAFIFFLMFLIPHLWLAFLISAIASYSYYHF